MMNFLPLPRDTNSDPKCNVDDCEKAIGGSATTGDPVLSCHVANFSPSPCYAVIIDELFSCDRGLALTSLYNASTGLRESSAPTMTAKLPPNLLRLFAPRPPLVYLPPLSKDTSDRGPNKINGIAALVQRLRTEAEDDEVKQGLEERKEEPMDTDQLEDGQVATKPDAEGSKKEAIGESGVVGQEAVRLRREAKKKEQKEYKENLEKTCESQRIVQPANGNRGSSP